MKDRDAVVGGLRALAREDANLDVKALTGHPGWYRLRVGNSAGAVLQRSPRYS